MSDLFQEYSEAAGRTGAYDEMFAPGQQARRSYGQVALALRELSLADVSARADSMARTFLDRGVTFDFAGEERPFPLDIVPRVIPADEWSVLERGVAQRVRALEAFLNDVYDKMTVVADGVIPRQLVTTSAHFHRQVHGFEPAGGVRVHISGIDVVRDAEGTFRVLEDNVREPPGHGQGPARGFRPAAHPPGRGVPAPAPVRPAEDGALRRRRSHRGGPDPRRVQQRLL